MIKQGVRSYRQLNFSERIRTLLLCLSYIRLEPSEWRQGCRAGLDNCTTCVVFNTKSISVTLCHLNVLQPKGRPWSWAVPRIRADDFRVMMVFVPMTSVIIFSLWRVSWGLPSPASWDVLCKSLHRIQHSLGASFFILSYESGYPCLLPLLILGVDIFYFYTMVPRTVSSLEKVLSKCFVN